jgi:hypothetical protein
MFFVTRLIRARMKLKLDGTRVQSVVTLLNLRSNNSACRTMNEVRFLQPRRQLVR